MAFRFLTVAGRAGALLCLSLCTDISLRATPGKCGIVADGPDAQLKEFCLDELEARLRAMQAGPERDYFAGVLANRTGHLEDSIRLLNDALPNIRRSEPARAAIALEALADDYNKSFRYDDAARTYDDLLAHFTAQLDRHRLQGTKDDSCLMHLLSAAVATRLPAAGFQFR